MLKLFIILALLIIGSCGGGGSQAPKQTLPSPTLTDSPVGDEASELEPSNLATLNGKVLFSSTSQNSAQSSFFNNVAPQKTYRNTSNQKITTIDEPKENYQNYLCYNFFDSELENLNKNLGTILKDIDSNGDGDADINLSYVNENGESIAYKNISSDSFSWDSLPSQEQIEDAGYSTLSEMFTPNHFLFDQYNELEKNIDSNLDGSPDKNITVEFKFGDANLFPDNLIFFNIEKEPGSPLINQLVSDNSLQHADISVINHDINFDGVPDINLDLDNDSIAETKIDQDGDCIFDFSVVDGVGATVAGAIVELVELTDSDNNGWYDNISDNPITAISDAQGNFALEGVETNKRYILKIVKDRGEKLVWIKDLINVQGELNVDIGTFTLTSAPILVGVKSSLDNDHHIPGAPLYGSLDIQLYRNVDFEIGKSWTVKLFVEDINLSDVWRHAPYRDETGTWLFEKLYFTEPSESESGFYEIEYVYELTNEGCFNVTLNSYSPLLNDEGNFPKFCDWEEAQSHTRVRGWSDAHYVNNSDDTWSAYNFDPDGVDLMTRIEFNNNLYDPFLDFDVGLAVNQITINDTIHTWNQSNFNQSIQIAAENDSLELNIKTDVEILDDDKNLNIGYEPGINIPKEGNPGIAIGEDVHINLEDYSFPRYQYPIRGAFCMVEGEVDGYCRNNDAYGFEITYIPNISEKPATLVELYADGIPWSEYVSNNIISAGDQVEFSVVLSDPNSLENEVSWRFINNLLTRYESDWVSESETFNYTFTQADVGASFRIDISWRNNDQVAWEWGSSSESGIFEVDGSNRTQFQVGE